ncbi:transporter, NhaC family [Shewanella psychrophila]|uniref:Transporter, NhaC family n=1 Tax=Shewanella psychrophila TaxID=225848 RepID=A0A1S6HK66_9GAMM|nr:Na+/H+ antiporter NhaC [Shewanella psychrophila]AQS35894.1 transporter, NhaC family [Shewanella psychrophila]
MNHNKGIKPSFTMALLPIALTLLLLAIQLFVFNDFTPHIPLAIGIGITAILARFRGYKWHDIEAGVFNALRIALPSIAILITVGMIVAIWIASGTVPVLIYYGLKLLSPELFLASGMLLCAIVSVSLGTSWGTVSTIGLALVGIGAGFDIPIYWTAGAVVSGAFFGDKMSPLSDTTNLAPAVTGVNLFDHIKNMVPTTLPSMLISLCIYLFVGFYVIDSKSVDFSTINTITTGLETSFSLSPWLLLPPAIVLFLSLKRMPSLPSLFAGVVAGAVLAVVVQGFSLHEIFQFMQNGFSIHTGVTELDSLLNRGGIQSMAWVITLVMISLGFGGALESTHCLESIIEVILNKTRSFFGLQAAAMGTAVVTNLVAGDPYLSISLPGRMFAPAYIKQGYSKLNLSRAVEEGGTLISPLIPWNAGGAVVITALGLGIADGNIENLLYIPLAFACWISPLIGLFYAATGRFSPKLTNAEQKQTEAENTPTLGVEPIQPN